jgi:hypothetical protein
LIRLQAGKSLRNLNNKFKTFILTRCFGFRKDFVLSSIDYLFRRTYETTDDMTISALLVYLNAAMPQDKHEDFDTAEVTKTAAMLHEKGRIVFEGDLIRLPD